MSGDGEKSWACLMKYTHPYLVINLLDGCNKACRHCYRTAVPSDHGFKLTKRDAMLGLDDASSLKTACLFAGGEPTIWEDGGLDFLSLLAESARRHGRVAFLSNGYVFEQKDYARRFVDRYLGECGLPLRMMFSVDFLHENYDAKKERIPFLDNLLSARNANAGGKNITLFLVSHWTNSEEQNIPVHVFENYAKQGVEYSIEDFMTWGRASGIEDLACHIEIGSTDKEGLGPYRKILARNMIASGKIKDEDEFEGLHNKELLRKRSVCGHSPNYFISWGSRYFYCIPQMGYDWFSISDIGNLDSDSVKSFFDHRPIIKELQSASVFGVLDKYRRLVKGSILKEVDSMRESIRFAGCSVCLRLFREGILQEINGEILRRKGLIM